VAGAERGPDQHAALEMGEHHAGLRRRLHRRVKIGNYQTGGPYGPEPYAGQGALLAVAALVVFIIAGLLLIVERGVRAQGRYHRAARPRSGMKVVRLPATPSAQPAPREGDL
jgi:hypothetical protein